MACDDEFSLFGKPKDEGPQLTSNDPNERKLARRIRLQKVLLEVERLRLGHAEKPKDKVAAQVEHSMDKLLQLLQDGKDLITNVRVAAVSFEIDRRKQIIEERNKRLQQLEKESEDAKNKFYKINKQWAVIGEYKEPLKINEGTEKQRGQCKALISQRDEIIERLKCELRTKDDRFMKALEKQEEDINTIVDRIDKQVSLMRKAYRTEINLLEKAIENERKEIIQSNTKKWREVIEQKDELEKIGLDRKVVMKEEHEKAMDEIFITHQEKYRVSRIRLTKYLYKIERELVSFKSLCVINKEKLNYNFQVLKKKHEENKLIMTQQKKKIVRLREAATKCRKDASDYKKKMTDELNKLNNDLKTLHTKIKVIDQRSDTLAASNSSTYTRLWDYNKRTADQLIKKIMKADKVFYEQQLGLDWVPPKVLSFTKESLPSFKRGLEMAKVEGYDSSLPSEELNVNLLDTKDEVTQTIFIKHMLEVVLNKSQWIFDEKLLKLLQPYPEMERKLVLFEHLFKELGLCCKEDIWSMANYFMPYTFCQTCLAIGNDEPQEEVNNISSSSSISEQIDDTQQLKSICSLEHIDHTKPPRLGMGEGDAPPSLPEQAGDYFLEKLTSDLGKRLELVDSIVASELYETSIKGKKTAIIKKGTEVERISEVFGKTSITQDLLKVMKRRVLGGDSDDGKGQEPEPICFIPNHELTIDPTFTIRALQRFTQDHFRFNKRPQNLSLKYMLAKKRTTISRSIENEDVRVFWENYRNIIPKQKELLWDALLESLKSYHASLQERHNLNEEIKKIGKKNSELRLLLQNYLSAPHKELTYNRSGLLN